MKIFIGADHRGSTLETELYNKLKEQGYDVYKSTLMHNENDDYPDFAFEVGENVIKNEDSLGIVICGNGIGVSIAANKVKGIRCARVINTEDAHHAKIHNGANVIALGEISLNEAMPIVQTFIDTPEANEERHLRRIEKIIAYENGEYNGL